MEERERRITEPWEGKMTGRPMPKTISTKQARIAMLAQQMRGTAIRSLSHHMDLEWLREAFRRTRKDGATGVDGQTADAYAAHLDENLQSLLDRVKSGSYRAPPVRRVHIPKADGSLRPLGIPTFEDKILQRAVVMLLEPIYEQDFYDFSFGFRPGRSAHDALKALDEGILQMGGGWILDIDVSKFFDTLDHEKLRDLLRNRVADGVVVRLIGKWLRAGVLEGGVVHRSETGSPQGGVISPLLANVYLHAVIDSWWVNDVCPRLRGRARLVRFADDLTCVFSEESDALRVREVLSKRLRRFGLTLHPKKTRLLDYRRPGGGRQPGSFEFLGFTHFWARSRRGTWVPKRKTSSKRFSRAKTRINDWLKRHRHLPIGVQSHLLGAKLRGHFQYYGVRGNSRSLSRFRYEVDCLWRKWLSRRSQRGLLSWEKYKKLTTRHGLPPARLPLRVKQYQPRLANL